MLLTFPLLSITSICLVYLLVNNHFEIQYVTEVTSRSLPIYLRITALWGGQAGSLILWSWLMSAFASAVMLRKWDRDREFLPWVIVVSLVTLVFFLFLNTFIENPFKSLWQTPTGNVSAAMFRPAGTSLYVPPDGNGMEPLLRHPGMILHPPMLYLGFVAFVIPYAFAIAALITGRTDDRWIRITRRWTLFAWLFLSLGLILGARWAYDVLGWGGYWGWDAVEVSALIPWLTGTAFLHSVMIQEKRGMLKQWNMVLIIMTYDLVIFGTFLTRSGVLSSVHAFAQSAIGPLFFGFIGLTFVVSLLLLSNRWNDLKSTGEMNSIFSREVLFLVNNLLFTLLFVVCFLGVIFPVLSEAMGIVGQKVPALAGVFTGAKKSVGPGWYESITGPLFAGLMLLMGIAPLSAWKHSTFKTFARVAWKPFLASTLIPVILTAAGMRSWQALLGYWLCGLVIFVTVYEFLREAWARHHSQEENLLVATRNLVAKNRRRYGAYMIHIAVTMMAVGILGIEIFQTQTQGTIPKGGEISLGRYTLRFDSLAVFDTTDGSNKNVARAVVSIFKDGNYVGEVHPRRDFYYESQRQITLAGVRSTMADDLYVILADWQPLSAAGATFKVYHNPLVNWVWWGGIILILGTLVTAWPAREPGVVMVTKAATIPEKVG